MPVKTPRKLRQPAEVFGGWACRRASRFRWPVRIQDCNRAGSPGPPAAVGAAIREAQGQSTVNFMSKNSLRIRLRIGHRS